MTGCRPARSIGMLLVVATAALAVGCAGRGTTTAKPKGTGVEMLPAEEAYRKGRAELADRRLRRASATLARAVYTGTDRTVYEPLVRLAIADSTFFMGGDLELIDARAKYLDFVTLYGDHPRAPYAQFQAGVCSLKQVRDPSRDQSQTLVAIADLKEVLTRFPQSPYARAAQDRIEIAERNLAEHEYLVGRFYIRRGTYRPAIERFRGILDRYPRFEDKPKVYFHLGKAMILANSTTEGRIYLDKLVTDWPGSPFEKEARAYLAGDLPKKTRGKAKPSKKEKGKGKEATPAKAPGEEKPA